MRSRSEWVVREVWGAVCIWAASGVWGVGALFCPQRKASQQVAATRVKRVRECFIRSKREGTRGGLGGGIDRW